jgi:two-component system CheB/CheR fusion protein
MAHDQDASESAADSKPIKFRKPADLTVHHFPIVGIGASAGGLAAFEAFFSGLADTVLPGMAFVLVQHLAPDHKSLLRELVSGFTSLQVVEIADGMELRADCVYVLPPSYDLEVRNGALRLSAPTAPHGLRLPIDHFFASLASASGARAVGIVLAGTGADGSVGLRAIKSAGGMVMAQDPAPPECEGMPQSAIATGLVDFQMPPAEMASQLLAYVAHSDKGLAAGTGAPAPLSAQALRQALALLHTETGHDFSHYKPSTIHQRIERRMAVHQMDDMQAYAELLQQKPAEVQALMQDLLIGVTSFFRDTEAFTFMQAQVVPGLFEGKALGSAIRVWCAACSTGQEAYSIAMLLVEHMEALKSNFVLQVFATDIDSRAIATARLGVYPLSIASELTPDRLGRFFTMEPGGQSYRIHKRIRDVLVFSEQDVIKDPPFSRLDLICCRNLLIYLDAFLQKRLIPLFHYALLPGGTLFLGSSEGIGEFDKLFAVRDRSAKVYQRRPDSQGSHRLPLAHAPDPLVVPAPAKSRPSAGTKPAGKPPLRTLMEKALLRQVTPSSVLVNGSGDVLYVHGHTGLFLEPSQGEVGVQNILKMAHSGLRATLTGC